MVEQPITDHLRDFASYSEKYRWCNFSSCRKDRNQEDQKNFVNFIPKVGITMHF